MKKPNYVNDICNALKELHRLYPAQCIGRHFDAAFADYDSLFGVTDKELAYALNKYQQTLEIDPIASDAEIDRILREGSNLSTILDEEENEEDEY